MPSHCSVPASLYLPAVPGPRTPQGRPCLWGWSHSLLPVCPWWEGCPVGPCGPWSEPGAGGSQRSVGRTPTASGWMCALWGASHTLGLRVPSGVVSLGLGGPKSMAHRVFRHSGRRREELVRAGVEERGAPEAWGTVHRHLGQDAAVGI